MVKNVNCEEGGEIGSAGIQVWGGGSIVQLNETTRTKPFSKVLRIAKYLQAGALQVI